MSAGEAVQIRTLLSVTGAPELGVMARRRAGSAWAGVELDSPGQPRLFGFVDGAWSRPPQVWNVETEAWDGGRGRIVGAGLSVTIYRASFEGRYLIDNRFSGPERSEFMVLAQYTFGN